MDYILVDLSAKMERLEGMYCPSIQCRQAWSKCKHQSDALTLCQYNGLLDAERWAGMTAHLKLMIWCPINLPAGVNFGVHLMYIASRIPVQVAMTKVCPYVNFWPGDNRWNKNVGSKMLIPFNEWLWLVWFINVSHIMIMHDIVVLQWWSQAILILERSIVFHPEMDFFKISIIKEL